MATPQSSKPDNRVAGHKESSQSADRGPRVSVSYKWEIIGGLVGFGLINSAVLLPPYRHGELDAVTMGVFGDFISGYIGQLIALAGLCFLIGTFRTERARTKQERFENRFFQLLQLHRDNAEEVELRGVQGRKVFVLLVREWRWILNIIRYEAQDKAKDFTQLELIQISYLCLFYGVGPNSSRMLKKSLENLGDFGEVIEGALNNASLKKEIKKDRKLTYLPFEGHQSRLGHYYRNLFQLVKFVQRDGPSEEDIREHMSTIRAQLSTHEQALLLLNSMTTMGARWWNDNLIEDYRLVHNIPADFFNPIIEFDPQDFFVDGYFETPEQLSKKFAGTSAPFSKADYVEMPAWKGPRQA